MNQKEELNKKRRTIDEIDTKVLELFKERMAISEKIALFKRDNNLPVTDGDRETEVINKAVEKVPEDIKNETVILMNTLMSLSKMKQKRVLLGGQPINFPASAESKVSNIRTAYQGVKGAWGEQAAMTLYPDATLKNYEYFEDIFIGVSKGEADYGVVPIENSQTGAIGQVYDLLRKYGCYIVGQTWLDIKHCLAAPQGTTISDIRQVYSHPEGFKQCHNFLRSKAWDTNVCRNTAVAAEMVADKNDPRCAAIASRRAAEVNGLVVLDDCVVDSSNNKTRFIAIASAPEYGPDSNITSITFSAPHVSGSLCMVLNAFMIMGINMSRIESRPAGIGKYRFFVDLEASITDENVKGALSQASTLCEYFEVLGCYS